MREGRSAGRVQHTCHVCGALVSLSVMRVIDGKAYHTQCIRRSGLSTARGSLQELTEAFKIEQLELRKRLITDDSTVRGWDPCTLEGLTLVGGVDISFWETPEGGKTPTENSEGVGQHALAALVVLEFPSQRVLYRALKPVVMTVPYIPGFVAFREVEFFIDLLTDLVAVHPELRPQIVMVDGNGVLHNRGFGSASHLGVLAGYTTIGIGKNLMHFDGLHTDKVRLETNKLTRGGQSIPLVGESGTTWGAALRSTDKSIKPIYVSVGHGLSLETALRVTSACCKVRIPEPVRQADLISRDHMAAHPPVPPDLPLVPASVAQEEARLLQCTVFSGVDYSRLKS